MTKTHKQKNEKANDKQREGFDFDKAFVEGVKALLKQMGRGSQKNVALKAGIKPSYLSDILHHRKIGTEKTRRSIAKALSISYEMLIDQGAQIMGGADSEISAICGDHPLFSESRASCIYKYAAEKNGLMNAHFFSDSALQHIRPPGWNEYINREVDDDQLYATALAEMRKLRDGL